MLEKDCEQTLLVGVMFMWFIPYLKWLQNNLSVCLHVVLYHTVKKNLYPESFLNIHLSLIVLRYYVTPRFVEWAAPIM